MKQLKVFFAALFILFTIASCAAPAATPAPAAPAATTAPAAPAASSDAKPNKVPADIAPPYNVTGPEVKSGKGVDVPIEMLGVVLSMDHTFQQQVAAGWKLPIQYNGKPVNINMHVEDPQGDIEKEISITDTYITKGIDAWLGYPLNGAAMANVSAKMKSKGIFMFTHGNVMPDQTMGMITDERDGGLLGGKMFVEWWKANRPDEKPYILVLDDPTSEAFERKPLAFIEYVKQNYPEAVFVGQQNARMTVEDAANIVSTYIKSHPEMNFIFAGVDSNVVGAMSSIEAAGRTDISIIGCGGEDNILPYLFEPLMEKKGGLAVEVAYAKSPVELGYRELIAAVMMKMDPQHVDPNVIDLGFYALTRDNVKDYIANKNIWLKAAGLPLIEVKK